jgi:hypothetical protein
MPSRPLALKLLLPTVGLQSLNLLFQALSLHHPAPIPKCRLLSLKFTAMKFPLSVVLNPLCPVGSLRPPAENLRLRVKNL